MSNVANMKVLCAASFTLALSLLAPASNAFAQSQLGSSCRTGQTAISGFLLWCDNGKFRYALPSDIPPTPAEGYLSRPSWYPRLGEQFVADNPPACPLSGHVTFTSPVIGGEDTDIIVPQGEMIGDHVTPIDHGYIGVRTLRLTDAQRAVSGTCPSAPPRMPRCCRSRRSGRRPR